MEVECQKRVRRNEENDVMALKSESHGPCLEQASGTRTRIFSLTVLLLPRSGSPMVVTLAALLPVIAGLVCSDWASERGRRGFA